MTNSSPTQVAGVYHRRLGDVVVTGLSDGYVDMGYGIFRNIPEEETKAILARDHRTSPPRISTSLPNSFAPAKAPSTMSRLIADAKMMMKIVDSKK